MSYKYLSSSEKMVTLTVAAFMAYLDDHIELWTDLKRPKDQIKYAKMAKSFAGKVLDFMLKDVNPEQVAKLTGGDVPLYKRGTNGALIRQNVHVKGDMEKVQVVVKYKDEVLKEYKRMEEIDSVIPVDVGDLDKLIYFGMASCELCELCGADAEACDMRALFLKYEAIPINLNPGDGCPFRQNPKG